MHHSSYEKMQSFRDKYLNGMHNLTILEIGSKDINGSHRALFDTPNWKYVGVDVASGANVDLVLKNDYVWDEIESASVDVVISGSVFEHIEYPWLTIREIARILKSNGLTCNIAPSAGFEHRFPVDCYRYYPDGFRALAKWAGLIPLEIYTDWDTNTSIDGGHVWHDTVMIAMK